MRNRVVSIHQPNLFPWLGYFYKIYSSDVFVILDDVQMQKTGASYTNRTAVLNLNGSVSFLTVPISRPTGTQLINEVAIVDESWRKRFSGTIQANYARAKFYKKNRDFVFDLIGKKASNLADFNESIILELYARLQCDGCEFVRSSSLQTTSSSTERLVDLVGAVGGDVYLSGGGGASYQDEQLFARNGIGLRYVNYPVFDYKQIGSATFMRGLSIIDAIFNIDFEGVVDVFEKGFGN